MGLCKGLFLFNSFFIFIFFSFFIFGGKLLLAVLRGYFCRALRLGGGHCQWCLKESVGLGPGVLPCLLFNGEEN